LSRPPGPYSTAVPHTLTHSEDREARRGSSLRAVAVALTALVAVTVAACGNNAPSEGGLQGKTATAITGVSVTAFHRQQSVAFVTKTSVGKTTTIEVGATDRSGAAAETVTTNGEPVIDSVLVDRVVYLRAAASFLEHSLSFSSTTATANEGKWISFQKGDTGYQALVNSLTPTQAVEEFVPEEPNLRVAGVTSVGGQTAVAVAGSPSGQVSAGNTATTTLFVSTTAPYLPLSATVVAKSAAGKTTERLASVFGKYNKPVDPIAPKRATPFSSISS
jgi:hypothetical protein